MQLDPVKAAIQEEIIEALNIERRGMVVAATSSGKTRATIEHIKTCYDPIICKILWVTYSVALRDTDTPNEFRKWGAELYLRRIRFICYDSLPKETADYDLIVLDECHHVSPHNTSYFASRMIGNVIGLTATKPKDSEKKHILHTTLGLNVVYELSLNRAIEEEIVPEFEIYALLIPLDVRNNIPVKNRVWKTSEYRQYQYWERQVIANNVMPTKPNADRARLKRYQCLANMPSKIRVAKKILEKLMLENKYRILMFATYKQQIKEIDPTPDSRFCYYAGSGEQSIEDFRTGRHSVLLTCNRINEGVNLEADRAIITQIQSNELSFVQRLGRILRKRDGSLRRAYITIMKSTRDEESFRNTMKKFPKINVKYINLKDV